MSEIRTRQKTHFRGRLRLVVGIFALLAALGGILINAKAGYSSWLAARVVTEQSGISALTRAISLDPSNARPYDVRARSLLQVGKLDEALRDFEMSVSLRPHDYLLWLRLGYNRAKVGDLEGARAAYRISVQLAPHYARPHWYMGMLLVKMNLRDEAFEELRSAVEAEKDYLPHVINTAWRQFGGDAEAVERAVRPQNPSEILALARVFLNRGKTSEAVSLFLTTGNDAIVERQDFVADLIEARQFVSAYKLWSTTTAAHYDVNRGSIPTLLNGGFESAINKERLGFGWQLAQLEKVSATSDAKAPNSGAFSLRIDFSGNSKPAANIVSQLVVVEPQAKYRLTFAGRAENLVTGGLPVIVVSDGSDGRSLAQSERIATATGNWQNYTVEFSTGNNTEAVIISLQRQACSSSPCPAFGQIWIDNFACARL
jgi:peroxin-5